MIKTHHPLMIAIVEPFINVDRGVGIRDQMGFDDFVANDEDTAKIWIFSKNSAQLEVLSSHPQALTVRTFE